MRRHGYALGETATEVRQYFEVSAYRNILDLLGALRSQAKNIGGLVAGIAMQNLGVDLAPFLGPGAIGAAIEVVGRGIGHGGKDTYLWWAKKVAKKSKVTPFAVKSLAPVPRNAMQLLTSGDVDLGVDRTLIYDLLNLGRQINAEMNRVRLPVPHNFRQFLSKMQNLPLDVKVSNRSQYMGGSKVSDVSAVNFIEAIERIGQLQVAVDGMVKEVRKEIDAAVLASQVQEQTIRDEREDLISRDQVADDAAEREAQIRAEKAIAYRADYDQLVKDLAAAGSRDEQDRLLGQIATVVAAINNLQIDSVGQVFVPEVQLLPTSAELTAAAQAVVADTQRRQEEIAQQAEQVAVAHDDLADASEQAAESGDSQAASDLAAQAAAQRREFDRLQEEMVKLSARVEAAKVAQAAAASGDAVTADAKLGEATAPASSAGKLLPLVGVLLLALVN
jgi:hypothetical protein